MDKIQDKTLKVTNIRRIVTKFSCLLVFILVFFSGAKAASAASLYFSPSSGTYNIGQTFNVSIYVSSSDQAINAASGIITFPADKLQITSLLKTGSIINFWVQEPSFSNITGTINFEGIVLNPGFIGNSGKIIDIVFKTKTAGMASIALSSASVLANDGQGTNILTDLGNANYALENPAETPVAPKAETPSKTIGTPNAPEIISSTHSDPNKWYQLTTAEFSWQIGGDITSDSVVIDKNPRTIPQTVYTPPITSKEINDLSEGVWYFHLQLKNNYGWGNISHFRIQIDKTPPEPFTIKIDNQGDPTNPRPLLIFKADDKLSGIDHYEIKIGEIHNLQILANNLENGVFKIPVTTFGEYTVIIRAVDKAGNYSLAADRLEIKPIEPPVIVDYPKELFPGNPLIIKGKSLKNLLVQVFIQDERKEIIKDTTKSDEEGNWVFVLSRTLDRGVYKLWAEAIDNRGARSEPSETVKMVVTPPIFIRIGNIAVNYLSVIITLMALLIMMAMVWLYGWKKVRDLKKAIKKETKEAETALYKGFDILREEIAKQVAKLDGKPGLSKKEKALNDELKTALNNAEKVIGKEIKDIRKELKSKDV